ncbi:MAG: hypothetical protein AAGF11_24825 [Myxococcota bacterium]
MRDLVLRPWVLIQRAVFDGDPRYVGPVKLALSLSVLSLLLTTWLLPADYSIDEALHRDAPEQWAALRERMATHQISDAHFVERVTDYLHLLTTILTLAECGFYALVLRRFDRSRPYLTHMGYALYLYSLWILIVSSLVLFSAGSVLATAVAFTWALRSFGL